MHIYINAYIYMCIIHVRQHVRLCFDFASAFSMNFKHRLSTAILGYDIPLLQGNVFFANFYFYPVFLLLTSMIHFLLLSSFHYFTIYASTNLLIRPIVQLMFKYG